MTLRMPNQPKAMSQLEDCPPEVIVKIGEATIETFTKPTTHNPHAGGYQSLKNLCLSCSRLEEVLRRLLSTHIKMAGRELVRRFKPSDASASFVESLRLLVDDDTHLELKLVKEFTLDITYLLLEGGPEQLNEAISNLLKAFRGMTGLKKLRFDGGGNPLFRNAFITKASSSGFMFENVEIVAAAKASYWILQFTPNVNHFAGFGCVPGGYHFSANRSHDRDDLMEALRSCPNIDKVDIMKAWDEDLIRALLAAKPGLKRLGMMGSKMDVGGIRFEGTTGAPHMATDGIFHPGLAPLLAKFKHLEVLIIPNPRHLGIFVISSGGGSVMGVPKEFIVGDKTEYYELYDVEDDDPSQDLQRKDFYDKEMCERDTHMRARFDVLYGAVSSTIGRALPSVKELWICGFEGAQHDTKTDNLRDVRIDFTRDGPNTTWTVNRGVLLDRVEDGALPYGAGTVKRLSGYERQKLLGYTDGW